MTNRPSLRKIEHNLGEILDRHGGEDRDLSAYAADPVGFVREVLGGEPWERQVEIAEAVRDRDRVAVRSCNGAGKDWLAARLALWWAYAKDGKVVLTGPTRAQVEEILMRKELRDPFRRSGLPGTLGVQALRRRGRGEASVLAKTATEVSALTGLHDAAVLFVVTEAQAEGLEPAFEAAFANAVGAEDRILAVGNPLNPSGPFYRACQPGSGWRSVKVPASEVPNVREDRVVVPGLMTTAGVDRIVSEYGEDSGYVQARVHAEFPAESEEGVIRRDWLEDAASPARWRKLEPRAGGASPVAAVDPARFGPDATCVCVRWGPCVPDLMLLQGETSTTEVASWVRALLSDARLREDGGTVVVDEVGLGGGVLDRLDEAGWPAAGFNGGRSPEDEDRFFNARAESYWHLRRRLEAGTIALPDDEELFRELLAVRWRPTSRGLVQLEAKRDVKARLGRSPDRADALAMAFAPGGWERGLRSLTFDEHGDGGGAPSRTELRLSRILLKQAYDAQNGTGW